MKYSITIFLYSPSFTFQMCPDLLWRMTAGFHVLLIFQRIFGEVAEKNLYLSQLIILDTLEKCLAGVSKSLVK